jgi:hypothetical protein
MAKRRLLVCFVGASLAASATTADPSKPGSREPQASAIPMSVGQPLTHANLTVFPIYSRERPTISGDYLTLDEALAQKMIVVAELPDAEVNRVSVTNRSGRPIYLMAGDLILGGQQDRVIARDTILSPQRAGRRSSPGVAVEVFCVEHGRWEDGPQFTGAEAHEGNRGSAPVRRPGPIASAARRTRSGRLAAAPPLGGVGGYPAPPPSAGPPPVASARLRLEAQQTKRQDRVWDRVALEARTRHAVTPTGTYRAVASSPAARQEIDPYVTSLARKLATDTRAVGLVAAVNGKATAADVFADRKLFVKQLPKLLKSYALDAALQQEAWAKLAQKPKPTAEAALALLRDAERGTLRVSARSPTTLNRERENSSTVMFEAATRSPGRPSARGGGFGGGIGAHRSIFRK